MIIKCNKNNPSNVSPGCLAPNIKLGLVWKSFLHCLPQRGQSGMVAPGQMETTPDGVAAGQLVYILI